MIAMLSGVTILETQQQQTASGSTDSSSHSVQVTSMTISSTRASPALLTGSSSSSSPQSSASTTTSTSSYSSVCQGTPNSTSTRRLVAQENASNSKIAYALIGGQSGRWFQQLQYPRLFNLSLSPSGSINNLSSNIPGRGTVWGGGWNWTERTISGWGTCDTPISSNPYILHISANGSRYFGSLEQGQTEWTGGDIFSASANGSRWMLTGMDSGYIPLHSTRYPKLTLRSRTNHLSLGVTLGKNFVDYSTILPRKMDGVLFARQSNGTEWLTGGGWESTGVLFAFNGENFTDLTPLILKAVPSFHSVQTIAWNGKYWLIGGVGFLAKYQGSTFTDLTPALNRTLPLQEKLDNLTAVNSIAWNGSLWFLGGGYQIASPEETGSAWLASFDSSNFSDLTSHLPQRTLDSTTKNSSILSIAYANGVWVIGGAVNNHGLLIEYRGGYFLDCSGMLGDTTYVDWVGALGS